MSEALIVRNLSKRFGGALALDGVDFTVREGEVHGLLGTNGSGKSTLIKVLAGFHVPEPGASVELYGKSVPLPVPGGMVRDLGLAFVHQHLGLLPSLSVTENLRLTDFAGADRWSIRWGREHERARAVFAAYGLALDPRALLQSLTPVERALLAIVRAVEDLKESAHKFGGGGVLVLDEPTPFLPKSGVDQLFRLVRQVVAGGASVVFVSHDVDEVREITDRATILRDGRLAGTLDTKAASHTDFVTRIVGRSVTYFDHRDVRPRGRAAVHVENLTAPGLPPVSFDLASGEILGLTGLIGSGFDRIPALLYGAVRAEGGRLTLETGAEHALTTLTPETALGAGIAYLPADRLGAAGIGSLSVADNVTLPVLDRLRTRFGLDPRRMADHAGALGAKFEVKPNVPKLPLMALSGGNQQKALMGKWLQTKPALLLLDEPTQGVDVGARQTLFEALDQASRAGTAILIGSTDTEQLAQICHRVLVFSRGTIVAELTGTALTKERIADACYQSAESAA